MKGQGLTQWVGEPAKGSWLPCQAVRLMFPIAPQYLLDQTDVLVVGVLGLQGTGKSMVMSLLSANTPEEDQR